MPFLMQWLIAKDLTAAILTKGAPTTTCGSIDTKNLESNGHLPENVVGVLWNSPKVFCKIYKVFWAAMAFFSKLFPSRKILALNKSSIGSLCLSSLKKRHYSSCLRQMVQKRNTYYKLEKRAALRFIQL
jgi:hypothetical protein